MNRFRCARRHFALMLVILQLVAFGTPSVHAQGRLATSPLLIAAAGAPTPGAVLVSGQGFTPGGSVYVGLYDQWSTSGTDHYETRWTIASATVHGPNGSQDPALGYAEGGTISELFGASETVYGPNGSQDPATGYVEGTSLIDVGPYGAVDVVTSPRCDNSVMVRAYDASSAAWSNMLDLSVGC